MGLGISPLAWGWKGGGVKKTEKEMKQNNGRSEAGLLRTRHTTRGGYERTHTSEMGRKRLPRIRYMFSQVKAADRLLSSTDVGIKQQRVDRGPTKNEPQPSTALCCVNPLLKIVRGAR